jgi:uncharacterized membrane protein YoaK (UPF0700 family)
VDVINKHPEKIRFPLLEQPIVGFLLALIAGLLNAWTFKHAATFATVQSGNVVSSGYFLVQGDWPKFTFAFVSVLLFGLGSAVCGVLMTSFLRKGKTFSGPVLIIQTAILAGLVVLAVTKALEPHYIAWAVSFVAGAQGNAFHKNHGMLYGTVAVTFVVQMAFNFLAQSLFSKVGINGEENVRWAGIFFLTLLGFAGGGALGFGTDLVFNGASMAVAALVTLALGVAAFTNRSRSDPTAGGTFA